MMCHIKLLPATSAFCFASIYLPVDEHEKAGRDGQSTLVPYHPRGDQNEFLAPGFDLSHMWLLWSVAYGQ